MKRDLLTPQHSIQPEGSIDPTKLPPRSPRPTDAAGEDGPAPWEAYWLETNNRLGMLEAKIEVGNAITDRLDTHWKRMDSLAKRLNETSTRLAALESRATPSDQDPAKQARPHKERIDDLVTRADGASSRLDLHMHRLDELWRRIDELDVPKGATR